MVFHILLYTSLVIFGLGVVYKVFTWFSSSNTFCDQEVTFLQRLFSAFRGILSVIFSAKVLLLIKVFILDVVLQIRIMKSSLVRWMMHMLIFAGFILLLLMHALESVITESLFSEYYSTLNPFLFLRDFFGVLVLFGLSIAFYRRFISRPSRLRTNARDSYAIIILAAIMISGIALEGSKMSSHKEFMIMVEDYAGLDDEEEIAALESLWVDEYALVSPNVKGDFDEETLSLGREVNEMNCMDCHASNKWGFAGFAAAKILKPAALTLDEIGGTTLLWYIHIILCFLGLAYLPFSKMFHIIATPISLMANAVMGEEKSNAVNIATRQAMEIDACTHCGACSLGCSASMIFEAVGNECILPSEKMMFLKYMNPRKKLSTEQLRIIQEGVYLCSNCDRCTVVCPSGISLKELWFSFRENLIQREYPEPAVMTPFSFFRGLKRNFIKNGNYARPFKAARKVLAGDFKIFEHKEDPIILNDAEEAPTLPEIQKNLKDDSFAFCFSCQQCTAVCPVMESYDHPEASLDLLPHQIMCCMGLGLSEMASGSRMIWECLTCYKCQEHCPQKVGVCDILFQLKNIAVKNSSEEKRLASAELKSE